MLQRMGKQIKKLIVVEHSENTIEAQWKGQDGASMWPHSHSQGSTEEPQRLTGQVTSMDKDGKHGDFQG